MEGYGFLSSRGRSGALIMTKETIQAMSTIRKKAMILRVIVNLLNDTKFLCASIENS